MKCSWILLLFSNLTHLYLPSLMEGKCVIILMRWIIGMNSDIDRSAFECQINHIWAHAQNSNTNVKCYVTRDIFEVVVASVKPQYLEVVSKLMAELHTCLPQQELHEALGIVYFHDWLLEECDELFDTHLNIMKAIFCTPKKIGVTEHVVIEVLCASTLDVQKSMSKITMKRNVEVALGPLN